MSFHSAIRCLCAVSVLFSSLLSAVPAVAGSTVNVQGVDVTLPSSRDFMEATGLKPLDKPLHIRACLFDPLGSQGPLVNYAKDAVLEARRWNVFLEIKAYTNEAVAAEDFKAGQCDAVTVSTLRAKQFNNFTGSVDSVGGIENYEQMKTLLQVIHTSPKVTPLLINGDYQVAGLIPLGAVYVMVNDRSINSIEKAAGKKVAVLDWDKSQAKMVQKIGAQPVASDITNFGGRFNNGEVDIIAAPAVAFQPLELYRGMGNKGAVYRLPLAFMTGSIVIHREKFLKEVPDFDAKLQKLREFGLQYLEPGFAIIKNMEKEIPEKYWMDLTATDKEKYMAMMREARIAMTREGVYDPRTMKLLKRIRCKHAPGKAECSLPEE